MVVLNLPENLGGSGVFYEGMKYMKENLEYDFAWLMDMDSRLLKGPKGPKGPKGLENLKKVSSTDSQVL